MSSRLPACPVQAEEERIKEEVQKKREAQDKEREREREERQKLRVGGILDADQVFSTSFLHGLMSSNSTKDASCTHCLWLLSPMLTCGRRLCQRELGCD